MMKNKVIIGLFFIGFPVCVLIIYFFRSRIEHLSEYDFVIQDIKTTPTKEYILHDGDEWVEFMNFSIPVNSKIEKGDNVHKGKCSPNIKVSRVMKISDEEVVISIFHEDGLFSSRLFCKGL